MALLSLFHGVQTLRHLFFTAFADVNGGFTQILSVRGLALRFSALSLDSFTCLSLEAFIDTFLINDN